MTDDTPQRAAAGRSQAERFSSAYCVLQEAIERRAFPGCAFGLLARGQVLLNDALGHFTYDEGSRKVTPETVFDIASLTKVVSTTAAAMLLHQRGRLNLDTRLGDLLPGFVVGRASSRNARRITLRNLLAHNSGLPGYAELFRTDPSPAALFRACLQLPLEAEPGQRAEYSDIGFILLGKALEVLTHEHLAPWVRREVFDPLKLSSTRFCPAPQDRIAIPPTEIDEIFRHRRIQGEVEDEHAWLLHGAAGHAGVFSNVPDLLRFSAEIIAASGHKNGSASAASETSVHGLFNPETVALFAQRQPPEGSSRALGWDTPSANSSSGRHFSARSIGHLGFSGCSLWIDLDQQLAVVLLTNRTWPDRRDQQIRDVRPAFHDALLEALAHSETQDR
ncbi:MAG TPA: serine hydrolase domain-containing protein [Terracidiphilus sp.]|nr:serine hydrolase domain-containing protein [Terracidiphilus sp.]